MDHNNNRKSAQFLPLALIVFKIKIMLFYIGSLQINSGRKKGISIFIKLFIKS